MSATTFSQLWDELKTEALNAVQSLKAEFTAEEAKVVPVIESDVATVLSQLKGVAVQIAATLATQEFANLTGAQKQAITINSIKSTALALGKTVVDQDVQMLAQQAYHGVQAALGTLTANAGK